jgi:hypothetical protein
VLDSVEPRIYMVECDCEDGTHVPR